MLNLPRLAVLAILLFPLPMDAGTPCSAPLILSAADVSVSDGTSYSVETWYRAPDESVVSFTGPGASDVVAEGPFAWYRQEGKTGLAGDGERRFAFGHQYHAMLLYFDEVMGNVVPEESLSFLDQTVTGRTGDYPYGGKISLIDGEQADRPRGFLMLLPDETPMAVLLADWRESAEGPALPYRLDIHHGGNVFTYRYSSVEISAGDAGDFHQRFPSPGLNAIDDYRGNRAAAVGECRSAPADRHCC